MKRTVLLGIAILTVAQIHSGYAEGSRPELSRATDSIKGAAIAAHVKILASDEYEGRAPGTRGEALTIAYIAKAFRAARLQPAFGKSYLQPVPLLSAHAAGSPSFAIENGGTALALKDKDDYIVRLGAAKPQVRIIDNPIVYVGYGVFAPERDRDDYAGLDVIGKTVLILQGAPPSETGNLPAPSIRLTERLEAAARHGALAAIIIHTEASMGYPWSTLSGGGLGKEEFFLPKEPATAALESLVYISEPATRRIFAAAHLDFDAALKSAAMPQFHGQPLNLRASIGEDASVTRINSHNVVGLVRGSAAPAECLILMAHWDHMGRDPSLKGDQIFNGAVDNATGVGALIEIGRALAAMPAPRRTIVLVATTAEERGLLGSEYLAQHPVCPLRSTIGAVAIDALFPFGPWKAMAVTGYGSSELEDILAGAAKGFDRKLQDDGAPQAGAFYRADNYPFAKRGVPGFLAVGGPDNAAPETDPQVKAVTDYVQNRYHHPSDEYDEHSWDMAGVESDARVLFNFAWAAANDRRFPNWYWISPYRALGDERRGAKTTK